MKDNTYEFMILTGKYLPDNNILFDTFDKIYYFRIYNINSLMVYFENSDGYWVKKEYNYRGQTIYFETSLGIWNKTEYNFKGDVIYYESSNSGIAIDER